MSAGVLSVTEGCAGLLLILVFAFKAWHSFLMFLSPEICQFFVRVYVEPIYQCWQSIHFFKAEKGSRINNLQVR